MTRPNIIRADTIDLQSQDSPSAKDHTRQPAHPAPLGDGPPAPHQAVTLRHAEQEASDLYLRSPRVSQDLSGKELQLLHDLEEDNSYHNHNGEEAFALGHNGGAAGTGGAEGDGVEAEGDDGLDDDMMDKISSSPSIDDGGYHLPLSWPDRGDSLVSFHTAVEDIQPALEHDRSSSPFLNSPVHFPLFYPKDERKHGTLMDHHQVGEDRHTRDGLLSIEDDLHLESRDQLSPLPSERLAGSFHEDFNHLDDSYEGDFDPEDFRHLLLPADDPLLDNSFDDEPLSPKSISSPSRESVSPVDHAFPEELGEIDDDTETFSFSDDDRFVDSGWGGECLRETEDIDFEFVYALHTFVATVEGQANATKGDTMVLLDDSNSYWWLVRVVKDSSIGYLPAEHIETPTERLARLNKHRNIDLSQTMLGDNPEKSKNPLKKAMRRRNAKQVTFAPPQFHEAPKVEYSSDEDEAEEDYFGEGQDEEGVDEQSQEQDLVDDEGATVESLEPPGQDIIDPQAVIDPRVDAPSQNPADKGLPGGEVIEQNDEGPLTKSRKGTVRNTDSFFKDDNVETRKINLTPSLLRDDSSSTITTIRSIEPREPLKTRPSLDSLEKSTSTQEKAKEERRRKEKKSMLGGLFKRKDKRGRGQDDETEDSEKISGELSRGSPQGKGSSESLPLDQQPAKSPPQIRPQRQTSKLQKTPPPSMAPRVMSPPGQREVISPPGRREVVSPKPSITEQSQIRMVPPPTRTPPSVAHISIPRAFEEPDGNPSGEARQREQVNRGPPFAEPVQVESPKESRRGMFSPIKDALLSSSPSSTEPKPEKVKRAKQRVPMDEFDSDPSPEAADQPDPLMRDSDLVMEQEHEGQHGIPEDAVHERLSESPVEVTIPEINDTTQQNNTQRSPQERSLSQQQHLYSQQVTQNNSYSPAQQQIHQQTPINRVASPQSQYIQQTIATQPPPLMNDTSSAEDPSSSPISSPSLIEAPQDNDLSTSLRQETPASTTQSSTLPPWNDTSLRAYLEDDTEIRDLLLLVHDKSHIKPAPPNHPIAKGLFKEENRRLGEMERELDGLLGKVLERGKKGRVPAIG